MAKAKIDDNYNPVIAGITDDADQEVTSVRMDPLSKRVKTTIEPLDKDTDSVTIVTEDEVYQGYGLFAMWDDETTTYILKQNKTGAWIMKKIIDATGLATYSIGSSDASTAWTNRASLTYTDYATSFG